MEPVIIVEDCFEVMLAVPPGDEDENSSVDHVDEVSSSTVVEQLQEQDDDSHSRNECSSKEVDHETLMIAPTESDSDSSLLDDDSIEELFERMKVHILEHHPLSNNGRGVSKSVSFAEGTHYKFLSPLKNVPRLDYKQKLKLYKERPDLDSSSLHEGVGNVFDCDLSRLLSGGACWFSWPYLDHNLTGSTSLKNESNDKVSQKNNYDSVFREHRDDQDSATLEFISFKPAASHQNQELNKYFASSHDEQQQGSDQFKSILSSHCLSW